jgi:hypothetical protein
VPDGRFGALIGLPDSDFSRRGENQAQCCVRHCTVVRAKRIEEMTMRASFVSALALAAVAIAAGLGSPASSVSAQNEVREDFTAFAINMNSGPKTATVDIRIERWSTDAEREQLLGILQEEKDRYRANQALLKALQKMPKAGFIRTPNTLAWDLRYARQNPMEDGSGRQIVVATDRPIGFWEARNQPRSMDYPFTILEMRLNKENKGEGKMLAGTQIYIDKKTKNLVLENYGQQPVRLNEIRPLK